jgi:hypothetical protein
VNGEIFYSLKEAQIVIEKWRVLYNTLRPHSALGYPQVRGRRSSEHSAERTIAGDWQSSLNLRAHLTTLPLLRSSLYLESGHLVPGRLVECRARDFVNDAGSKGQEFETREARSLWIQLSSFLIFLDDAFSRVLLQSSKAPGQGGQICWPWR